jgi:hypothetical protein
LQIYAKHCEKHVGAAKARKNCPRHKKSMRKSPQKHADAAKSLPKACQNMPTVQNAREKPAKNCPRRKKPAETRHRRKKALQKAPQKRA